MDIAADGSNEPALRSAGNAFVLVSAMLLGTVVDGVLRADGVTLRPVATEFTILMGGLVVFFGSLVFYRRAT